MSRVWEAEADLERYEVCNSGLWGLEVAVRRKGSVAPAQVAVLLSGMTRRGVRILETVSSPLLRSHLLLEVA